MTTTIKFNLLDILDSAPQVDVFLTEDKEEYGIVDDCDFDETNDTCRMKVHIHTDEFVELFVGKQPVDVNEDGEFTFTTMDGRTLAAQVMYTVPMPASELIAEQSVEPWQD